MAVLLSQIRDVLGISNAISKDFAIRSLTPLEYGDSNDVSYIDKPHYFKMLASSQVGAVLVRESDYHANKAFFPPHTQALFVANPHLAFALLSTYFARLEFALDVQKASSIDASADAMRDACSIHPSAQIMPHVYIGANVSIGARSILMPGVVLSDDVRIGEDCRIYPNTTIYRQSEIGNRVYIHAGSVIGSDGFGYAHTDEGEHKKIEHSGIVIIEDDVEIGANTTIDRAVFGATIIKRGTKIDNLVQIGHNCVIGEHSLIVAQVGFAGSTTTGRNVIFGGQAGTGGHVHIGDFVQVAARGGVSKNLPPHTKWGGHPLLPLSEWMRFHASIKRLLKKMNLL